MGVDMKKMKHAARRSKGDVDPDDIIGDAGYDGETIGLEHQGIEHETDKAALVVIGGDKVWIPKSQIVDADGEGVVVKKWWADKEGYGD